MVSNSDEKSKVCGRSAFSAWEESFRPVNLGFFWKRLLEKASENGF